MSKELFEQARSLITASMGGFGPELILCLGIILLLLHDLFSKGANPTRAAWLTLTVLVLSGFALCNQEVTKVGSGVLANSNEIFGWFENGQHKGMLALDKFGLFFKAFVLLGTIFTIPMCLATPAFQRRRMGEFYVLILAATLGMFLMAAARNMLMIYMGIEFASMASYLAVAFLKKDRKGSEAGLKYVIYGSVASGIMIYGMSMIYGMTGSLYLGDMVSSFQATGASNSGLAVAAVLVFAGFAYKMAAFPMHFWAPDVYEGAPTPMTAYLSVTSKAAGFAVFIRFFMEFGEVSIPGVGDDAIKLSFGWQGLTAAAAALSMTAGNLAALWQTNVKRMLAYSSIAHAGYLLMGVAVLNPASGGGDQYGPLLFYFIVYFFMNLGGFFIVTLVAAKTGTEELSGFSGLFRRAPILTGFMVLCLISLLGIPPTGGFSGKLQLFFAVIKAEYVWLAIVAGINTAISAFYYFRLIKVMCLDEAKDEASLEPRLGWLVMVGLLALPVLPLGLVFNSVAEFSRNFGM